MASRTKEYGDAPRKKAAASSGNGVRVTDDSLRVRQLTHYQFSWTAAEGGADGIWTLQLVLDEGAWEEILTVSAEDADNLQDVLTNTSSVFYDIDRRVLMFGVTKTGSRRAAGRLLGSYASTIRTAVWTFADVSVCAAQVSIAGACSLASTSTTSRVG